jgi:hypothetical protein
MPLAAAIGVLLRFAFARYRAGAPGPQPPAGATPRA